jgi:hypothetical protein
METDNDSKQLQYALNSLQDVLCIQDEDLGAQSGDISSRSIKHRDSQILDGEKELFLCKYLIGQKKQKRKNN